LFTGGDRFLVKNKNNTFIAADRVGNFCSVNTKKEKINMHNEAKPEAEEIYIAVATGYAIYGLGKDEAEAITDAKKWVESEYEDNLENIIVRINPQYNDFTVIKISRAVKERVEENGGSIEDDEVSIVKCPDGIYRLPEEVQEKDKEIKT
jgi:hypothetical protein